MICSTATCVRACHQFEVENARVSFTQDFSLGSHAKVRCDKGHLIENRELPEMDLTCKHTDAGSRFCTSDNICTKPKCTKGE